MPCASEHTSNRCERDRIFLPLPRQALRYPYFQVGQILGPRPDSHEVKKVQARQTAQRQASEAKADPQQSSSESKASTSSSRNQQQPLQQIPLPQPDGKPGGVSHAVSVSPSSLTDDHTSELYGLCWLDLLCSEE